MALVVEDGSIVAGAESFVTVAAASTYHSNRGNTAWAALASDAVREQCLRKATDYMEQMYRSRWKGFRVSSLQVLSWPRADVELVDGPYRNTVANNIVPDEVKNACSELALKAATAELAPDLTQAVLSETVGPISTSYDKGSPEFTRYRAIDAMLALYLTGSSLNSKLVRS